MPGPIAGVAAALAWRVGTGDLLGAMYVAFVIMAGPGLGATTMIGFVIFGQLAASTLLDHYEVVGAARPVSPLRPAGGAMLFVRALPVVRN